MADRQIKDFLVFSFFILFFPACLRADVTLPEKWEQQLNANRRANQLEDWIYTWVDALGEQPENTLAWSAQILAERWRAPQTEDEHSAWLALLVHQGFNLSQHGTIIQSITAYEQAYDYYSNYPFMPPEEVVKQLIFPLSNNYILLCDYARALFIQEKALSLIQDSPNVQLLASLYNDLATSSRWAGNPGQASIYASNGLAIPDIDALTKAQLLTSLADIELFREVDDGPENYIKDAYAILSNKKLNKDVAQHLSATLEVYAGIHTAAHRYQQALVSFDRSLHLLHTYFPGSKPREKAKIWVEKGNIYLKLANYQHATHCFAEATKLLLPVNRPDVTYAEPALMDVKLGMAKAHIALRQPQAALNDYQAAFSVSEKLRQMFYSQNSKYQEQQSMRETAEEAIALAYGLYKKNHDPQYMIVAFSMSEQHKARVLADELNRHMALGKLDETNQLVKEENRLSRAVSFYEGELIQAFINKQADTVNIRKNLDEVNYQLSLLQPRLNEHYPSLLSPQLLNADVTSEQMFQLPDSVQVQAYFCGLDYWYAFSFSKTGSLEFDRLGKAQVLDSVFGDFNRRYFQEGPTELYNRPKEYLNEAEQAFKLLFKRRRPERALLIIPDGALSQLPFDALITRPAQGIDVQDWPFLTTEHRLSNTYSLANWYEQSIGRPMRKHAGTFAGFFVPFMGIYGQDGLPAVQAEMTRIKNLVRGDFFWDDEAKSATLLEQLPQADVVHISTHAMLVGPDRVPMLLFRDKKVLIPDLYQSMIQPSLVVLGACQSGSGWLDSGEGLLSLAREFVAHGTGGVVSGLWNINDEVAAQFMEKFYQHLLAGENKAEALHRAKLDWLGDPHVSPMNKLPYYWAGIIYNGDFDRVYLRHAWPWANEVLVGRVLLAISLASAATWIWWQRKLVASLFKRRKKRYW